MMRQLNPDDAWPYTNRGFAKIKLGQPESALADCDEAIRLSPEHLPSFAEAYGHDFEAKQIKLSWAKLLEQKQ